jgi:hypothetical protein
MRTIKYLLMFVLSMALLNSCFEEEADYELNDDGPNLVTFDRPVDNLGAVADGGEYTFQVRIRIVGPTVMDLTSDISVNLTENEASTAKSGAQYRLNGLPIVLTKANNYLGFMSITLITEGNSPPMEGTPEYDAWVAPVLLLDIEASGDSKVIGSGKGGTFTINFRAPNPYAGLYMTEMRYFHPTAGGSHPSFPDFDPDDPYGGIRQQEKELIAITGRKCETGFAVWWDTDICWITVNPDNSINFEVADTWPYEVSLGDPFDPDLVSHFDPDTRMIYLYYHYTGAGGDRIFWEVFTPEF